MIELLKRFLFGTAPYLGCLGNKELDDELTWIKQRESA